MRWAACIWPVACLAVMVGSAAAQETPQTGAPAEWANPALEPQVFTFIQADRLEGRTSDGEGRICWRPRDGSAPTPANSGGRWTATGRSRGE